MSEEEVLGPDGGPTGGDDRPGWTTRPAEGRDEMRDASMLASHPSEVSEPELGELDLDAIEGIFTIALEGGPELSISAFGLPEAAEAYRLEAEKRNLPHDGPITKLEVTTDFGLLDVVGLFDDGEPMFLPGDSSASKHFYTTDEDNVMPALPPGHRSYRVEWTITGYTDIAVPSLEMAMDVIETCLDPSSGVPLPPAFMPKHSVGVMYEVPENGVRHEFEFKEAE